MSDELYQREILERAKAPVRAGRLASPDATATVDNPLCGDRVTIDLKLDGDRVSDISHHVRGCALCQASASVIAATAIGQTARDIETVRAQVRAMLGGADVPPEPWQDLGIFTPVRRYKSRHECVILPFDALSQALGQTKS